MLRKGIRSMTKVNLVVQARMGSSRLPGKMMLDLYGEPLIFRILERLSDCKLINQLILAIPDGNFDDVLAEVAARLPGVATVRGSEENLVDRFQAAIKSYPCEFVIRFPGDNVFPDPVQIDNLIRFHLKYNPDGFSSNLANVNGNNMIDGVGAEIFSTNLLMNLTSENTNEAQKEHLHLNFYDYQRQEVINSHVNVDAPDAPEGLNRPEYILDINTIDQYRMIREIYKNVCMDARQFSTGDIVRYLDSEDCF